MLANAPQPPSQIDRSSASADPVFAKISARLIPFLFVLYVLAHIDRANVSFLKTQIGALGITNAIFALGTGIFYIGYALFEVPSNLVLARVGARRWIARIMITWGIVSASMMLMRGVNSFYTLRFLLGVAEAGFFPGVLLYLTYWFPAHHRAKASALFLTSIPVATVISGPLSGYCLKLDGHNGWHGWQWVFLLEGIPSILAGVAVMLFLPNGPRDAQWLDDGERRRVESALAAERARQPGQTSFLASLREPRLWLLVVLYFLFITGFYGINTWLPPIWKQQPFVKQLGDVGIGWITAIPYALTAVTMVLVGRSSDRCRERRWHASLSTLIAAASLAVVGFVPNDQRLVLIGMTVTCLAMFSALGPFWSLATEYLRGTSAAGGIALINGLGCLGGFAGPYLLDYFKQRHLADSGPLASAHVGYLALALSFTLFGLLVLAVRKNPGTEGRGQV